MNKKTVSKVNLFFGGLVSRMEENKDFFNDITINLKSGTKNFPAKILYTDDITLDYQAVTLSIFFRMRSIFSSSRSMMSSMKRCARRTCWRKRWKLKEA